MKMRGTTKGALWTLFAGLIAYAGVLVTNDPVPRPDSYNKVSVKKAYETEKPVELEGTLVDPTLKSGHYYMNLEFTLTDGKDSIVCGPRGIMGSVLSARPSNFIDDQKKVDLYRKIVENLFKKEKTLVRGEMGGDKLDAYEVQIGDTNYILTEK